MTSPPESPDWSRLPHDPLGFFGLSEGFERRELKRRYNQLIRRYKPEKHPQEFQRIRVAFEQLDLEVRYGHHASRAATSAEEYRWLTDVQQVAAEHTAERAKHVSPAPNRAPGVQASPLHERLQGESPGDIYRELASKSNKSAFDYYALAVMSDLIDHKDRLQFARWLLQGVAAHPADLGLARLLHEYVRGPVPDGAVERLLVGCSQVIREDAFFALTEPLWQSLLRSREFARFRATLERCEANLSGVSIDGRLAFYLQILKSALWQADELWIEQAIGFIEENFERIPFYLEYDVELVTTLKSYLQFRRTFIEGHPLCRRMDQALRDYFEQDQAVGDRSVLECQMLITQDTDGLSAAFSQLNDPAYAPFYAIWSWISHDVAERHAEANPPTAADHIWQSRIQMLLEQIGRQTARSNLGRLWNLAGWGYRGLQFMCFIGPVLLFALISAFMLPRDVRLAVVILIATVASIVAGLLIGRWLANLLTMRVWFPLCVRISGHCYRRLWQREVMSFLARSHVPYHSFSGFVEATDHIAVPEAGWVKYYVEQDYALAIYSLAQRFVV